MTRLADPVAGRPPPTAARPGVTALEVLVRGVVQGVGFRPFVHRAAAACGLDGWVRNEAGAVRIRIEGTSAAVEDFLGALRREGPPLARIDRLETAPAAASGVRGFAVRPSAAAPSGRLPVPPDVAPCTACEAELRDPASRRFGYPFTTCTDCGPRFTVIREMPFDRERTTMAPFALCDACRREYGDPTDRRHHAQTQACPTCGPRAWLEVGGRHVPGSEALREAGRILVDGGILAVRGVGGFHLACDATSDAVVARLRRRKGRDGKPLAVMVRSLDEARSLAVVTPEEADLLRSPQRPIVVLEACTRTSLAPSIAPGLSTVGLMLASTPLHHLLLDEACRPLVMTSGNVSDEPIAVGNDEGRRRLAGVADAFLLHDRDIAVRCDDSLVRRAVRGSIVLRRARGWAPLPIPLPGRAPVPILAVGPHLKSTLTLADGSEAWVSQHLGDLENLETLEHFQSTLAHLRTLSRIVPRAVVRDLHPGYLSTRVAEESGLEMLEPVQHHHAHIAAVLGEHRVEGPVLGLAFDGTGWGPDGTVWGCEFLVADAAAYRRVASLRAAPLPGGDAAARSPWRVAAGYLSLEPAAEAAFGAAFAGVPEREREIVLAQAARGLNAPLASSLGRLFDAAAAVLGLRAGSGYEAQAAMELEALAGRRAAAPLPFPAHADADGLLRLDPLPLLDALGTLRARRVPVAELAARFQESVVAASAVLAELLCRREGLDTVALGGGCFQNVRLLDGVADALSADGLRVLVPRLLPANDGGVSYGQAVVAVARTGGG